MTVVELAKAAGLSTGMLQDRERRHFALAGHPAGLSRALHVPVTAFFRRFEEERDATFVAAGEGLTIERRGTRAGHQYELLGHSMDKRIAVEPYLITLTEEFDVFPLFQHSGIEFIYMLEGEVGYTAQRQDLCPAARDLYFDADAPHGPEDLRKLPIRFLSIITYPREEED